MPAKLITVNQAARLRDCRVEEIYRLLRRGKLSAVKVNGRWNISMASIASLPPKGRKHAS